MLRFAALLVSALVVGVIATGCGEESKDAPPQAEPSAEPLSADEYSELVDTELEAYATEVSSLGDAAARAQSPEDLEAAVEALRDRIEQSADTLAALSPPEEASQVNEGLVSAFQEVQGSLAPVLSALAAGDPDAFFATAPELQASLEDFDATLSGLEAEAKDAGLDIPSLGAVKAPP